MSDKVYKAALIGCGGMGRNQARILKAMPEFDLTAVCDLDQERVEEVARATEAGAYTDVDEMLEREKPEVVAIPTANTSHAPLTLKVADYGVRAIFCEKPMAMNPADARAMVEKCREKGILLVINHQRRLGTDLVEARRLIEAGAIGEVLVLRGYSAGDMLSDGTHAVDSLMYLAGDPIVNWVFGTVERDLDSLAKKWEKMGREVPPEGLGHRYGHPVESGAIGIAELQGGTRLELFTGELRPPKRIYQDYVIEGTRGTLWRVPDKFRPNNLFISDAQGGDLVSGEVDYHQCPVPAPEGGRGSWRLVDLPPEEVGVSGIEKALRRLARSLETGEPHPMDGEVALRGFQIVMGVYESARRGLRVTCPFETDRFPLEIMLEEAAAHTLT